MRKFILAHCLILALAMFLTGCLFQQDVAEGPGNSLPDAGVALTVHNPICIINYQTAREYSAEGRYELAKEHYLLAYAAAEGDPVMRGMLQREITSVDMMLKTLR